MARSVFERTRRRLGGTIVDGFFQGVSRLGRLHPRADPSKHGVRVVRDVRYAPNTDGEAHLLDVWIPEDPPSSGKMPVVLYVHGGGFRILSKDTHWVMALAFARRGYLVFNVSYRLAPEHPFPAAVDDVCQAYRFVVDNAHRWGGDPSRLAIAGESAGANLATSLTIAACYQRPEPFAKLVYETGVTPRAVLPACGIFQVTEIERFVPHVSRFVADRLHEVGDAYIAPSSRAISLDLADTLPFFERGPLPDRPLPPFFLPVGTRDPLVDDTRRLARALRRLGVPVTDTYYEGEHHAFHAFVFLKNARKCWNDTYAFLDEHLPAHEGLRETPTAGAAPAAPDAPRRAPPA